MYNVYPNILSNVNEENRKEAQNVLGTTLTTHKAFLKWNF